MSDDKLYYDAGAIIINQKKDRAFDPHNPICYPIYEAEQDGSGRLQFRRVAAVTNEGDAYRWLDGGELIDLEESILVVIEDNTDRE